MDEQEYATIEEASRLLSRSVATVWRIIRRYELQTFRRPLDRKTYVRRADIERLQAAFQPHERGPRTDGGKEAA